ncbi:aminoacyl tRNA synthase complex-interacting multifunctional protein 1-like [Uloborus diversus]|uniref:aminoacyl tRNA synthase complex-interacting multifunctional protein 1-like n=1 Tax=Uloborus diversus TaxID=327109 RepID=UPI00240995FB|nr:aminoacyl tRNA synthase complex-interacting multifunctional protein 1-like [Uloborus diversus]
MLLICRPKNIFLLKFRNSLSNFVSVLWNPKMGQDEILQRIQQNNKRGEEMVQLIQSELPMLRKVAEKKYYEKLLNELKEKNTRLKLELEYWKSKVIEVEVMNGIQQYPLPSSSVKVPAAKVELKDAALSSSSDVVDSKSSEAPSKADDYKSKSGVNKEKQTKTAKPEKKPKEKPASTKEEDREVNVSRLDFRVGRILSAKKHPDAESLYVEEIDVGEEKPRTVVSGLVKFVPLEEMQNRLVIVLCNLKPAKMRGITSEAMVMCASTPEKVEILIPPAGSLPGDRVVCEEFPGEPDALLPPKKKIFEQVAPDLKTNMEKIATYKSAPLKVLNKGVISSATLTNVMIK